MTTPADSPTYDIESDNFRDNVPNPPVDVLDLGKMKADLETKRDWLLGQIKNHQEIRARANTAIQHLRGELETTERVLNSLTPRKRTPRTPAKT